MTQVLLIAAAISLFLRDSLAEPLLDWWITRPALAWVGIALLLGAPGAAAWLTCRRAGREIDRTGSARAIERALRAAGRARSRTAIGFAIAVLGLGWLDLVRSATGDLILLDEALALVPLLASLAWTFWIVEPIERRLREAFILRALDDGEPIDEIPSRPRFVWLMTRTHLLATVVPLFLLMTWMELLGWAQQHHPEWFDRLPAPGASITALSLAGLLLLFALAPLMLKALWETRPLGVGEHRERIEAVCAHHGVRVRDILVWQMGPGVVNAAVMGLIGRLRFVLVTPGLLDQLPADEVEAVAAHEIAHVRRRHIPWLAASVLGVVLPLTTLGGWAFEEVFGAGVLDGWLGLAIAVVGVAGALLLFGYISRRFEWQADAFAAAHLSGARTGGRRVPAVITEPAAASMSSALRRVARLNGMDPHRRSWRHGSIALRRARLAKLVGHRSDALPIDRAVARLKLFASVGVVAAMTLALLDFAW